MDKIELTCAVLFISVISPLVVLAQPDKGITETMKDGSYSVEVIEEKNDKAEGESDGAGEIIREETRPVEKSMKILDFIFSEAVIEFLSTFGLGVVLVMVIVFAQQRSSRRIDKSVKEAEEKAFEIGPESFALKIEKLDQSQIDLEERAQDIASLIEQSREAIKMGHLFNLYNKQLEKYQKSTQFRASYSFAFAIFAMLCGLGFVFWGATHILTRAGFENIAAGSAISAIGGCISAYITKTFLDVHKTSLNQLNRYFRQPVINEHILTAQRLADYLDNNESRQKAYESIIHQVTELIREDIHLSSSAQLDVSNKKK